MENAIFIERCKEAGNRLKELIKERRTNTVALGKALGVSKDAVDKYVSGKSLGTFMRLAELADLLGVTPNYFLGISGSPPEAAASAAVEREIFLGLLEGVFVAFEMPLEEAVPLADSALEALEFPSIRKSDNPREEGRRNGTQLVERFFVQAKKSKRP